MSMALVRKSAELARSSGVAAKTMRRLIALNQFACQEVIRAAHQGWLAPKHAEIIARALNHHDQRQLLAALPTMSLRVRHETISALRNRLVTMHHKPRCCHG